MGRRIVPNDRLNAARKALLSPSGSGRPMSRQELADACNAELAVRYTDRAGKQRWAGLTEKAIGALERGDIRWPNDDYRWALCRVLQADERTLGFYIDRPDASGERSSVSRTAVHTGVQGTWSAADDADTVDAVKRRTALTLPAISLMAAALPTEPWKRLSYILEHPGQLDEATLGHLEGRTTELFRQEEQLPARQLAAQLGAHVQRLQQLAGQVPEPFARRVLATTGEALALAGWVAWDSKQYAYAEELYGRALRVATDAGDGPLYACVLAYQSYGAEAAGDLPYARELLRAAQGLVRGEGSAGTRAWLAAREAEVDAALGESTAALRALERAMTAYDYAHPHRERSWTGFFTPTRLGSMTVTAYARLDHADLDSTADAVVAALPPTDAKIKAVILADVAAAAVQRGRNDRAALLGHQALDQTISQEASLGRQRLRELHLMIVGKRSDPALAELDDRLLATVA
ncbi:hypothetical protein GCM10009679_33090 [Saccharothrix algeriensis]|uniref:Transcriptional regulator n=2 Tax=Catellatospora bangladeshensis TaxID=310355 RepID=A0A8J3J9M5_9ACTN|nr:hypothetical protein [Catellatospora bangladeshensis]GIF80882.1 hypothetical protein Cba03nite_22310 [Catellatospora bangladeshensis]